MTGGKGRGTGKRRKRCDLAMKIMVDKQLGDETSASEQKGVMQWTGIKLWTFLHISWFESLGRLLCIAYRSILAHFLCHIKERKIMLYTQSVHNILKHEMPDTHYHLHPHAIFKLKKCLKRQLKLNSILNQTQLKLHTDT